MAAAMTNGAELNHPTSGDIAVALELNQQNLLREGLIKGENKSTTELHTSSSEAVVNGQEIQPVNSFEPAQPR